MATPQIPMQSGYTDFSGLSNLASLFLPKNSSQTGSTTSQNSGGTSTSGTQTTSTNVSQDAVNALVQQILEGSQGLAATAGGQKTAGLYNSSTNQMLVNDLISRAAAAGAKLNSSTTTSTNSATTDNRSTATNQSINTNQQAQIAPSKAAGLLSGMTAVGKLAGTGPGQKILNSLGLGNGANGSGGGGGTPPNPFFKQPGDTTVDDAITSGSPNVVSGAGVASNVQSIPAYGNNPSAFVSGDNTQVVNSLTGGTDFGGAGDLSSSVGGMDTSSVDSDFIYGLDLGSTGFDVASGAGDFSDVASNATGDYATGDWGAGDYATGDWGAGDYGAGDWGIDPTTIDYGGGDASSYISDLFDFAEGGMVTPQGNHNLVMRHAAKKGYAGGGYVNIQAEKAFASGGDETPQTTQTSASGNESGGMSQSDFANYDGPVVHAIVPATQDYVSVHKSLIGRILQATGNPGKVKSVNGQPKGYANGGIVDTTNMGLRIKDQNPVAGIGVSGDNTQSVTNAISNKQSVGSGGIASLSNSGKSGGTTSTNAPVVTNNTASNPLRLTRNPGSSDNGPGTPGTGVSGTPASNNAAVAGMAQSLAGMAFGPIGAIATGLAMDAFGVSHSSMNPVTNVAEALVGLMSDPISDVAATASANNTAPTQSDDNAAVANAIANDNNMDPMDALVGIVDDSLSPDAVAGFGVSGGGDAPGEGSGAGPGASAGDAGAGDGGDGSSGDGSGSDGGSASAKKGGMIRGPGTGTSDSIPARLSNGEYVIKAAVVKHYGKSFFDNLNNSIKVKGR